MNEDAAQVQQDRPTTAEVRVIAALCSRWPRVIDSAIYTCFRSASDERQQDARSMLIQYLLEHGDSYLDRYVIGRDRHDEQAIHAGLDAVLSEPRGAFRMWVRSMTRWVLRDWGRRARQQGEHLEVRVAPDGTREDGALTFERLAEDRGGAGGDHDSGDLDQDLARDVVAEIFVSISPVQREDVSLFLAAEAASQPTEVYKAWGTTRAAVLKRLRALEEPARDAYRMLGAM